MSIWLHVIWLVVLGWAGISLAVLAFCEYVIRREARVALPWRSSIWFGIVWPYTVWKILSVTVRTLRK